MFKFLKFKKKSPSVAESLYKTIVTQARKPQLYTKMGVPDDIDGRLSMLFMHTALVVCRLDQDLPATGQLRQDLFDCMFTDIELSLREQGVGDQGIPHRMKKLIKQFYGSVEAYRPHNEQDNTTLKDALMRNVFTNIAVEPEKIVLLSLYINHQKTCLSAQEIIRMAEGKLEFTGDKGKSNV